MFRVECRILNRPLVSFRMMNGTHRRSATVLVRPWTALALCALLLPYGCGGGGGGGSGGSTTPPLSIGTTSLPNGQVGNSYSATLAATGGAAPLSWSVSTGALPGGLSLNASSGLISGTPTAAVNSSALTVTVSDSSKPALTKSAALTITIMPVTLTIPATTLPSGQLGSTYSAALTENGGTPPYTWSISAGTLPRGLSLNAQTGAIGGVPGAVVSATPLTFKVQDSSSPQQSASVNLALTVAGATLSVTVSQLRAGLTVTQPLSISATTNDAAGVTWSISPTGGALNPAASASGVNVTLTAPSAAGVYTLTATSVSDTSKSSSATIGVTDLAGAYTYHNDLARDGSNAQEYALTTANVTTASFGKLFSCTVDGAIYAQPLWVANLTVGGGVHNVVFVATAHDGLFAFDADASPCLQLWTANLIDTNHGANAGEITVPSGTTGNVVGSGYGDITPEVGVIGTPVIDPATRILYVLSKSVDSATKKNFYQRLHAIDLTTGNEKPGSPMAITSSTTFPGTGDGGSTVKFNPQTENQRAGLALVNGTVYVAWASHEDTGPYYGWVMGYSYNGSTFTQTSVLNVVPNVGYGGIWMSGGAPAADAAGNLYLLTANGGFDAGNASAPNNDYGDSYLKLSNTLQVMDYFTPSDQASDESNDYDFGAGGAAVLADLPAGSPVTHLALGGGKDSQLYVINRDQMGQLGDANAWEQISLGTKNSFHGAIFSTPALWNNNLYVAGVNAPLSAFQLDTTTAMFTAASTTSSPSTGFHFPGSTPSVSASGTTNGIVWALDVSQYCTQQSPGCGPAVLHAYDATNLKNELWNSGGATDTAGNAVKFTVPTIANGKVYVGTRGNDTGKSSGQGTVFGELDVYGLKPN